MNVTYFGLCKREDYFPPKKIISFVNRASAERYLKELNKDHIGKDLYILVEMSMTMFAPPDLIEEKNQEK